jgi:hypothetical protein
VLTAPLAGGIAVLTAVERVVTAGPHRELPAVLAGVTDRPSPAAVERRHLHDGVDNEPGALVHTECVHVAVDIEVVTVRDTGLRLVGLVVVRGECAVVCVELEDRYPEVAVEHDLGSTVRLRLGGVELVWPPVEPPARVPVGGFVAAPL